MVRNSEEEFFALVDEDSGAPMLENSYGHSTTTTTTTTTTTNREGMLAYSASWIWRWFVVGPAEWAARQQNWQRKTE